MRDNRKDGTRLANQTGSQSGNPRNQSLQRDQDSGDNNRENAAQNKEEQRRRRGNSSGDKKHGGNR